MAEFWDWKSEDAAPASSDLETTDGEQLEPVEIYTRHAMVFGFVAAHGHRLSDILNSVSSLSVRDPRSVSLLNGVDGTQGQDWAMVDTDEILMVMPPPRETSRQLRVHRSQLRIRIRTGPFEVVGNAYLIPGTAFDPYSLQGRMRFMALTRADVHYTDEPAWERSAEVILVNISPVNDLEEIVAIS
jgi:hypothetical protein